MRYFGSYTTDAKDVPAAVQGYFENGGEFCYVTRIVHYSDVTSKTSMTSVAATVDLRDRDGTPEDTLRHRQERRRGATRCASTSRRRPRAPAPEFNLIVKNFRSASRLETWANLSMVDANGATSDHHQQRGHRLALHRRHRPRLGVDGAG